MVYDLSTYSTCPTITTKNIINNNRPNINLTEANKLKRKDIK